MKAKISIITLGVADFKKSLAFYKNGLGFEAHKYDQDIEHVMFKMDGTWLSLFPKDELAKDAAVSPAGTGFSGITLAHNVGTIDEVDTVYAQAISAGAIEVKKPKKVSWGGYSGYFADIDGYLWEVAYNPYTDLT